MPRLALEPPSHMLFPWKYRRKWSLATWLRHLPTLCVTLLTFVCGQPVFAAHPSPTDPLSPNAARHSPYTASHRAGTPPLWQTGCPVESPCYCESSIPTIGWAMTRRITCSHVTSRDFPRFRRRAHDGIPNSVTLMYAGLSGIPGNAFHNLYDVSELDMQGNDFQDHINPRAFLGVGRNLRDLNLAWSNITTLHPKLFRGMTELRNLSLAENNIRQLAGETFQDLRSLERLSLAGNKLTVLPGQIFRFQTNLEMLDLGYCRLKRLPWNLLVGLWNLKLLDLRGNHLASIDSYTFMDLISLHTLLLSHNPIWRLQSRVFHGLRHVSVLRLEESRLQHVAHDAFHDTRSLSVLALSDNRLATLPPGALLIPGLQQLRLDGNRLGEVPPDIAFLQHLTSLDLSYNNIETLDRCVFDRLPRLQYLNLRQNPFVCDCSLAWLRKLKRSLMKKWTDRSLQIPFVPGRCRQPRKLRGVAIASWLDLDCFSARARHRHHLKCNDDRFYGNQIDDKQRGTRHSRHLRYQYFPIG